MKGSQKPSAPRTKFMGLKRFAVGWELQDQLGRGAIFHIDPPNWSKVVKSVATLKRETSGKDRAFQHGYFYILRWAVVQRHIPMMKAEKIVRRETPTVFLNVWNGVTNRLHHWIGLCDTYTTVVVASKANQAIELDGFLISKPCQENSGKCMCNNYVCVR